MCDVYSGKSAGAYVCEDCDCDDTGSAIASASGSSGVSTVGV